MRTVKALLAILPMMFGIIPAQAASTTPTPITNTSDAVHNPYQETVLSPQPPALSVPCQSGNCSISFPAIITETLVKNVSCHFGTNGGSKAILAELFDAKGSYSKGTGQAAELPIFTEASSSTVSQYGINTNVYLFFAPKEVPTIDVEISGTGGMSVIDCTISGTTG